MIKCSPECMPTCQHCINAEYEELGFEDDIQIHGEAEKCKIHPDDENVSGVHYCDDFHCFMEK